MEKIIGTLIGRNAENDAQFRIELSSREFMSSIIGSIKRAKLEEYTSICRELRKFQDR
jgi:hypothetical protein